MESTIVLDGGRVTPFANPRNATAGTLRQLDSSVVAKRKLDSFMYYVVNPGRYGLRKQSEALEFLKEIGFKVNPNYEVVEGVDGIVNYWRKWLNLRNSLEYNIDGIVIKVNDFEYQKMLGNCEEPKMGYSLQIPRGASENSSEGYNHTGRKNRGAHTRCGTRTCPARRDNG